MLETKVNNKVIDVRIRNLGEGSYIYRGAHKLIYLGWTEVSGRKIYTFWDVVRSYIYWVDDTCGDEEVELHEQFTTISFP